MTYCDFNAGDKVAWAMPMDVYEGIVICRVGELVEVKPIRGPNNETFSESEFIAIGRLKLVRPK